MQDAVQSRSQLPSVLCQGNCPQNVASVPQNKQPLGQPRCVPNPGLWVMLLGASGEMVLSTGRTINSENRWE